MLKSIAATVLVGFSLYASACDVCGGGDHGGSLGILPQFHRHFLGLRYRYSHSESSHPMSSSETPDVSDDHFHTAELWGRYEPFKRLQLFAFVPFVNNRRNENGVESVVRSLGDATLLANFVIFNSADTVSTGLTHALQVGAGIKLATGKYNIVQNFHTLNPNQQPGTGSFDIPVNLVYTLKYQKVGMNMEAGYRFNTTNDNGYKFGDRFNSALKFFYWKKVKSCSLLPQVGLNYEHSAQDLRKNKTVDYTGGQMLLTSAGLDVYYKKISIGISAQLPVYQQLSGGFTSSNVRVSTQVTYLF